MPHLLNLKLSVLVESANDYKDKVAQNDGCYTKKDERHNVNPKRVPRSMLACHFYPHKDLNSTLNEVLNVSAYAISNHDCYYVPGFCGVSIQNKTELKIMRKAQKLGVIFIILY